MDSALTYAYLFDMAWFILLTGVLMLAAGMVIGPPANGENE